MAEIMIRRLAPVAVVWAVLVYLLASQAGAASPVIVTVSFDDGTADHYSVVRPILASHGVHGTFYINSGLIGTDPYYTTWDGVAAIAADGNEIAGHGLMHESIGSGGYAAARFQVCQDRVNLFNHGYQPTSFAYPNGSSSATAEQAVADCGYNSGRLAGGISKVCRCGETIPPANPYAYRAAPISGGTKLSTLQQLVINAENGSGGWIEIFFHLVGTGRKTFPASDLSAFLGWLNARGTPVQTVHQVLDGPVQPPVLP